MKEIDLGKYKEDIARAIQDRLYCKFERSQIKDNGIYGYPLKIIEEWCVISRIGDFSMDGYYLFRIKDLTYFESYPKDSFYSGMLIREGVRERIEYNLPMLGLKSIRGFLSYFIMQDENIIMECEKLDEYYIGKLKRVTKSYVLFHYFNPEGVWCETLDKIRMSSVTSIQFRCGYVNVFSKYLPPECPTEDFKDNVLYIYP